MKIDFEFQTERGTFRDALHLPDDHTFSDAELAAMKARRRDNWVAAVTAPPVEPEPEYVEINGVQYAKVVSNG